ncbi:MAG TPA: sulfite reductase subunit alpha, partial [Reyranella sp.]
VHLALSFDGAAPAYNPGDSLDLYPQNDPAYVHDLLKISGLSGDEALRNDLLTARDVTTLSAKTVETYAASTGDQSVKKLIAGAGVRDWIAGRQLIDLLAAFPTTIDAGKLRALTRPLAPRAYSIASARSEVGDEAHLLISAVRYDSHGRARKGVASNYVAERLKKGDRVRVKLKPNKHFALPAPDKDIIMVGPGTGVAPFRAFLEEREARGAKGGNWLFFGEQKRATDFLYEDQIVDWQRRGVLKKLDLAFSRDQSEKIYVQHRMRENATELWAWLDQGAHFYVCGDAKRMAKDVEDTLLEIAAEQGGKGSGAKAWLDGLAKAGRYQRDVY